MNKPQFEIIKRQEVTDDIPSPVKYSISQIRYDFDGSRAYWFGGSNALYGLSREQIIELRERLNALELDGAAPNETTV